MKILVLGGDSFLGINLLQELKKTKHIVESVSLTQLNFQNLTEVENLIQEVKPEVIFNAASHVGGVHYVGSIPADIFHDNVQMSLNIYKAVLKKYPVAKIINALANCSYPGDADIQSENEWLNGPVHDSVLAYGNAKRFIYILSQCYFNQYGIKSINFIMPNYFGPGDETDPKRVHALGGMIIRMIQAQRNNQDNFEIWGSGKPIREWGYIKDIVNVLIQSINSEADLIYPLNIGQNKGYSIAESATLIAEELEYKGGLVFNTKFPDGAPTKILDDKKFQKVFPNFQFTDHKQAIKETVKYYLTVL